MTDVALEAKSAADKALLLIAGHEQICAERQGHIVESLSEIKRELRGLYNRFWVAALFIITTLFSVVGALLYLILTKGAH